MLGRCFSLHNLEARGFFVPHKTMSKMDIPLKIKCPRFNLGCWWPSIGLTWLYKRVSALFSPKVVDPTWQTSGAQNPGRWVNICRRHLDDLLGQSEILGDSPTPFLGNLHSILSLSYPLGLLDLISHGLWTPLSEPYSTNKVANSCSLYKNADNWGHKLWSGGGMDACLMWLK